MNHDIWMLRKSILVQPHLLYQERRLRQLGTRELYYLVAFLNTEIINLVQELATFVAESCILRVMTAMMYSLRPFAAHITTLPHILLLEFIPRIYDLRTPLSFRHSSQLHRVQSQHPLHVFLFKSANLCCLAVDEAIASRSINTTPACCLDQSNAGSSWLASPLDLTTP